MRFSLCESVCHSLEVSNRFCRSATIMCVCVCVCVHVYICVICSMPFFRSTDGSETCVCVKANVRLGRCMYCEELNDVLLLGLASAQPSIKRCSDTVSRSFLGRLPEPQLCHL